MAQRALAERQLLEQALATTGAGLCVITPDGRYPSVESAVESMKLGAVDYLTKPFLPEELLVTASHLLEEKRLRDEKRLLQRQVERPYSFGDIIGRCACMQTVFDKIRRVAEANVDVLIAGTDCGGGGYGCLPAL